MKRLLLLLPFFALQVSAQKLSSTALQAARQHTVMRASRVQRVAPSETVSGFIRINDASAISQLEALGITIRTNINNHILTATMPVGALEPAAAIDAVERIELGADVTPKMDMARAEAGADLVRNAAEGLERAYKGKGVIVGVVDQGFEYHHIAFKDESNTTPRILKAWNQTTGLYAPPANFSYGTEFVNYAAMKNVDNDFQYEILHGTHVANIAAGADMKNSYYGLATESDLIFVTYDKTADQIVDGVKYIFDQADKLGKPCVVNVSIGLHVGPHDGTSLSDQAFQELTGPGRIIVGAVGNEGTEPMHVGKKVTADSPLIVIPSFMAENYKIFACDFWGEKGKNYYIQPVVVNSLKGSILAYGTKISCNDYSAVDDEFSFDQHGIRGYVHVAAVHDLDNGRGNFYVTSEVDAQGTGRMFGLIITTDEGEECYVDGWNCYHTGFYANDNCQKKGFSAGDYNSLCGEIGGTSDAVISVGSYNTRMQYTAVDGVTYGLGGPGFTQYDLSPFSSNGPTTDGRMKPDVCAPGFAVISAAQRFAIATGKCAAVTVDGSNKYYYEQNAGTSMAAPYVTGSVALWLEAKPDLSPEDVRNILRLTSRRDEFTGALGAEDGALPTGDNRWGYGKIDTFNGLLCAINYDKQVEGINDVPADAGHNLRVVLDRPNRQLRTFLPGTTVEVYNAAGRLVSRSADLSALPAGSYIVRLRNAAAVATQKIIL